VAARINNVLSSGLVSAGPPPVSGIPLFSLSSDPNEAAATLTLNDTVTAGQLAEGLGAIQPGPPLISNGIPLTLAGLLDANVSANLINGKDPLAAFGRIASSVGGALQAVNDGVDRTTNLLMQARAMREELSGVSLDGEAARIIELQRGYQAIARVANVIDEMMQSVLGMVG
jgi:flagellar hook-associated protein FlgK